MVSVSGPALDTQGGPAYPDALLIVAIAVICATIPAIDHFVIRRIRSALAVGERR